jgi:hypothetical protein
LTNDKNLYQAGVFGGARIDDVVETAKRLRGQLMSGPNKVDLVVPMTHQVIAQDRDMARLDLGFPLLVGGHDHDVYVEKVNDVQIVKVGADATYAAIIDITWPTSSVPGDRPHIRAELLDTSVFAAAENVEERVRHHMRVVEAMEKARLARIPPGIRMKSIGMRREPTTVGVFVATAIRNGVRAAGNSCDGAMIDAGAIRANKEYPPDLEYFTYGDLKKEIPFDTEIAVIPLSGKVVKAAVEYSRAKSFLSPPQETGGYLQVDEDMEWDSHGNVLLKIGGKPLEPEKMYNIAVVLLSLHGMNKNQPLIDWSEEHADLVPPTDSARPAKNLIIDFYCKEIWRGLQALMSFDEIDEDASGELTAEEVRSVACRILGQDVPDIMVRSGKEGTGRRGSGSKENTSQRKRKEGIQRRMQFTSPSNDLGRSKTLSMQLISIAQAPFREPSSKSSSPLQFALCPPICCRQNRPRNQRGSSSSVLPAVARELNPLGLWPRIIWCT